MFFRDDAQNDGRPMPQPLPLSPHAEGPSLVGMFKSYWDAARGADPLPDRNAIDPNALDAALPFSFVAERVAPEILRLRVAGHRIGQMLGMDPRGMPLCGIFTSSGRETLGPIIAQVMDQPAMAEMRLVMARGLTRPALEATMVLMPLQGPHGQCDRVMGAIFSDFVTAPTGARFDIDRRAIRLEPVGLGHPRQPDLQIVAGGLQHRRIPTPRGGLRLVVDNG